MKNHWNILPKLAHLISNALKCVGGAPPDPLIVRGNAPSALPTLYFVSISTSQFPFRVPPSLTEFLDPPLKKTNRYYFGWSFAELGLISSLEWATYVSRNLRTGRRYGLYIYSNLFRFLKDFQVSWLRNLDLYDFLLRFQTYQNFGPLERCSCLFSQSLFDSSGLISSYSVAFDGMYHKCLSLFTLVSG